MHGLSPIDGGNNIDWGRTSDDYADWRPSYPSRLFQLLQGLGIGLPGQRLLDLGTGTGLLALQFARQGAEVTGVDVSPGQIEQARRDAARENLQVAFHVAAAEETGLAASAFEAITAGQSWLYFDHQRMIPEVRRLLADDGVLVTCHFCWLPRQDAIARASEALVLAHNPNWSAADWSGEVPMIPRWAADHFQLQAMLVFDVDVPFSRDAWRGRLRACRGVGASLDAERVRRFDQEHRELLDRTVPEQFTVRHRVDAHVLRPRPI